MDFAHAMSSRLTWKVTLRAGESKLPLPTWEGRLARESCQMGELPIKTSGESEPQRGHPEFSKYAIIAISKQASPSLSLSFRPQKEE